MRQFTVDTSRRNVLRAIGAGAVLSAAGGTAIAQSADDGEEDGTGTVHEVETLISGPPTNPQRPADFFFQPTGIHVEPGDVIRWVFTTPDHTVVSYHPAFGMRRRIPVGADAFSSPLLGWRPDSIPDDQIEPPAEDGHGDHGDSGDDGEDTDGNGEDADGNGDEPEDNGDDGGPVPDTWLQTFDVPGVYDILCSPHEGFGMAMRVVVGDETETNFETDDPDAMPAPRAGPVGLARVTLTDQALQPENIVEEETVEWGDLQAVQPGGTSTPDGED